MIFDAHLDLAFNAAMGRDLTRPLPQQLHGETALVTFDTLKAAQVNICLGTLWAYPQSPEFPDGYTTPEEAHKLGRLQLEQYLRWQDAGHLKLLKSGSEVWEHWHQEDAPLGVILLMEGADPLLDPDDLQNWAREGLRVVGPAWGRTRYSGGTGAPGGLTAEGQELVQAIREQGLILDASHMAEEAFWDAAASKPRLMASHSNARNLVPTDRHLSDEMLLKIAELDGMVGLVLFSSFIRPDFKRGMDKNLVGFSDLLEHARHMADLIGWERVGLGSDLDGGFGMERTPRELHQLTDLERFFELLPETQREKVQFQNWLNWFSKHL